MFALSARRCPAPAARRLPGASHRRLCAAARAPTSPPTEQEPMYFVTCRNVLSEDPGPADKVLGLEFNGDTRDNLRVGKAWAVEGTKEYMCKLYPDKAMSLSASASGESAGEGEGEDGTPPPALPSEVAFLALIRRAGAARSPVMVAVHGFNVTTNEGLESAARLQAKYGAEVVPFLWPANGRWWPWDYLNDKRDAEKAGPAYRKFMSKVAAYHAKYCLNYHSPDEVTVAVDDRGARHWERRIPAVTLLCHSMGNYLLKHAVKSKDTSFGPTRGIRRGEAVIYDNIILTAADVNSEDHVAWVSELAPARSVFICSNAKDKILRVSDLLPGPKQKVRLGQTVQHAEPLKCARVYVKFDIVRPGEPDAHGYHWDNEVGGPIERFYGAVIRGERFSPADVGACFLIRGA